ncbi:MAG: hypothetical protein H0U67_12110, partial [Gemmatimonadetes bacterium]|nr:hypothetical protein [Gemmatimonadota bacterium]
MTAIIRRTFTALALALIGLPAAAQPVAPTTVEVSGPSAMLVGAPFNVTIRTDDDAAASGLTYEVRSARGAILSSGAITSAEQTVEGIVARSSDDLPVDVVVGGTSHRVEAVRLPAWVSVLPPLMAIALALIFREVVISLFAGVWLGAFLWTGLNPLTAVLRTVDTFALPALADSDHAAIIIFSLLIGGMVGIIGRNGGT